MPVGKQEASDQHCSQPGYGGPTWPRPVSRFEIGVDGESESGWNWQHWNALRWWSSLPSLGDILTQSIILKSSVRAKRTPPAFPKDGTPRTAKRQGTAKSAENAWNPLILYQQRMHPSVCSSEVPHLARHFCCGKAVS